VSLREVLKCFSQGEITLEEAARKINLLTYRSVGELAKIDPHREDRIGVPEAILAEGKNTSDLLEITRSFLEESKTVIITRVSSEHLTALKEGNYPPGTCFKWMEKARVVVLRRGDEPEQTGGKVGIISAGTADIPVAEEAKAIAEAMGCEVITEYDVGVAGIHRLFPSLEKMMEVDAIVVAAGREGTLPSVVAGLIDAPIIGLPVSTGYGVGGRGLAALHSMLQSCSVMTVVNIDAGFVAGAFAAKIANQLARKENM